MTRTTQAGDTTSPDGSRSFQAAVWVTIIVLALFSPAGFVFLGWFTDAFQENTTASEVSHRLHEVVFGIMFTVALVGAVSQVRSSTRRLAGLLQTVATIAILAVVIAATVGWDPGLLLWALPVALMFGLRPRVTPVRSGPTWGVAALLTLTAFPVLLRDVSGHIQRAMEAAQNHTTHWGAMAAFGVLLVVMGVIVAMRVTGYRLTAVSLGLAGVGYGAAALAFPYDASSHRPGFAIAIIIWGVAWLAAARYLDRPAPDRRPIARIGIGAAVLLTVLIAGSVWTQLDVPPNVPHRPHPDVQALDADDVDRATCLGCHGTGAVGAPIVPHDADRNCVGEPCWGGRTDCIGCHRIDPVLGGPEFRVQVEETMSVHLHSDVPRPLTPEQLAAIAGWEVAG